jgi:hypothetical protein
MRKRQYARFDGQQTMSKTDNEIKQAGTLSVRKNGKTYGW